MRDTITLDRDTGRVTLVKANGNTFVIYSWHTANTTHRRGAQVVGDNPRFTVSLDTKARILKIFYPHDSLAYLKEHGYIAY